MFSFGIFTDVHYAKDTIYGNRYCSYGIEKLQNCIKTFNQKALPLAINLGDLVDKSSTVASDLDNLVAINHCLKDYEGHLYHALGNHDLEQLSKNDVCQMINTPTQSSYYAFDYQDCRFIILDANFRKDGIDYERGNYVWTDSSIPAHQQHWLMDQLDSSPHQQVIICIHQNLDFRLYGDAVDPHIVQNASAITSILENTPKNILVLQGHYHHGDYQHINGVDYVTLKAMCEGAAIDDPSYAVVHIEDNGSIVIEGFGAQPNVHIERSSI